MSKQPTPIAARNLIQTMRMVCDICGKPRGGTYPIKHDKCSKIRQARGFPVGIAKKQDSEACSLPQATPAK